MPHLRLASFIGSIAAALWVTGASAAVPLQHSHSLESDQHDSREDTVPLRSHASERVGWRDERAKRDRTTQIRVLSLNDFHGQLVTGRRVSNRPVGSAPVLASYLNAAAAAAGDDDSTLIIHAGDHVGATTPSSALLQDEPSIQFLNQLANRHCFRFDPRKRFPWWLQAYLQPRCNLIGTLGNHESDEGVGELLRLIGGGNHAKGPFLESPYRGARFPYVSANVVRTSDGEPILPPYTVKVVEGVPVAVIGAVLRETPTIVTPTGVAGVTFLDEATAINRYVRTLRAQGIRTIIVTIHQGIIQSPSYTGPTDPDITGLTGPIVDIVRKLDSEVDLVVSGHAHGFTNALIPNAAGRPILVTQAFSAGTAYGDIELTVSRRSNDVIEKSASIVTTWADEGPGLTPDADAAALTLAAEQATAPLVGRVIGFAPATVTTAENAAGESAMGNLIADAQRVRSGAQFAFMNPGGIRAGLDAGEVTWGDLFVVQPFGNDLVSMDLTGAQVRALLEQQWAGQSFPRLLKTSGLWYRWQACPGYNPSASPFCPQGGAPAVQEIRLGSASGALIDAAQTYRVTVNSFMAAGGDNFLVLPAGVNRIIGPVDLDVLVSYVEVDLGGNVAPAVEGRIVRE
jgi:5'-nucleotidase